MRFMGSQCLLFDGPPVDAGPVQVNREDVAGLLQSVRGTMDEVFLDETEILGGIGRL